MQCLTVSRSTIAAAQPSCRTAAGICCSRRCIPAVAHSSSVAPRTALVHQGISRRSTALAAEADAAAAVPAGRRRRRKVVPPRAPAANLPSTPPAQQFTPLQRQRQHSSSNDAGSAEPAAAGKSPAVVLAAPEQSAPGCERARPGPGQCAEAQLAKQFRDLLRHPIAGISAAPDDEDVLRWHVRLAGPPGSPYEGGWFDVQLQFGRGFPGQQPVAIFKTPIWHPNFDVSSGRVCITMGSADGVCSVPCVLCGLQMLLAHPNPDSPLNDGAASQMRSDMLQFRSKAQSMTAQHAMS